MTRDQLRIKDVGQALDKLDRQWPRLKELRDSKEHILGPTMNAPAGTHYLGESVADLQPGGGVEYLVHVEHMEMAIDEPYNTLCELLDVAS